MDNTKDPLYTGKIHTFGSLADVSSERPNKQIIYIFDC